MDAFGLRFSSPVCLAAGFDKGEGIAPGLFALGFAAVEAGTITPRAQPGNPKPRLFRLPNQRALINRMGFNNEGADEAAARYREAVFRPGPLCLPVAEAAIEAGIPRIWFQLGIPAEAAARRADEAGLTVVLDHCAMVEHRRRL